MFALLPDLDQELVDFLRDHANLSPLHGGRVGTSLQEDTLTAVRVTNLGGTVPWPWETTAEYALEAWGGTQTQANLLARTLVAAIYDLVGAAVDGGRVVGVDVRLGPLWQPDETTARAMYRTDVALTAMP